MIIIVYKLSLFSRAAASSSPALLSCQVLTMWCARVAVLLLLLVGGSAGSGGSGGVSAAVSAGGGG